MTLHKRTPSLWVTDPVQPFEIPNIDFSKENFSMKDEATLRGLLSELESVNKIINENSPTWLRLQSALMSQINARQENIIPADKLEIIKNHYSTLEKKLKGAYSKGKEIKQKFKDTFESLKENNSKQSKIIGIESKEKNSSCKSEPTSERNEVVSHLQAIKA